MDEAEIKQKEKLTLGLFVSKMLKKHFGGHSFYSLFQFRCQALFVSLKN